MSTALRYALLGTVAALGLGLVVWCILTGYRIPPGGYHLHTGHAPHSNWLAMTVAITAGLLASRVARRRGRCGVCWGRKKQDAEV